MFWPVKWITPLQHSSCSLPPSLPGLACLVLVGVRVCVAFFARLLRNTCRRSVSAAAQTTHVGAETFQRYRTRPPRRIRRLESLLVIRYQSEKRERRLPGISASEPTPAWSPDGKSCDALRSLLQSGLNSGAAVCGPCLVCPTERQMLLCFGASSLNRKGGLTPGFILAHLTGMSTRPVPCRASPAPPPPPRQVETSSKAFQASALSPPSAYGALSGWIVRRNACSVDKGVLVRNTKPEHLSL